jgi:Cu+-exporting ATPase
VALKMTARRPSAGVRDHQVIEILVADGYHPDVIEAEAGVPIRVVFRRQDEDPCSDRVVFSSPRIERHLALRSVTVVDLPAVASGDIRFTCGMGRYRGRIEVVSADARSAARQHTAFRALTMIAVAASVSVVALAGLALDEPASAVLAFGLFAVDVVALVAIGGGYEMRGLHRR